MELITFVLRGLYCFVFYCSDQTPWQKRTREGKDLFDLYIPRHSYWGMCGEEHIGRYKSRGWEEMGLADLLSIAGSTCFLL